MENNFYLPYATFSGTGFELGEAIGRKFRSLIQQAYQKSPFIQKLIDLDDSNPELTDTLIALGKKYFPLYMEEIRGTAKGADLNPRKLYVLNFRHSYNLGCSTVMMRDNQQIFLGHNEDHEYFIARYSYIIKVNQDNGFHYLSHLYPGCLAGPSFWMNSEGLGLSANAMNEPKKPIGIPKGLLDRAAVDSRNLQDLLAILQFKNRAGGYSYNIFSMSDFNLLNLETTSTDSYKTLVHSNFCHTNHYIGADFSHIPYKPGKSSDNRLRSLQSRIASVPPSTEGIKELLLHEDVHVEIKTADEKAMIASFHGVTGCTAIFHIDNSNIKLEIIPYDKSSTLIHKFRLKDKNISKIP
jgi:hypothetical protein